MAIAKTKRDGGGERSQKCTRISGGQNEPANFRYINNTWEMGGGVKKGKGLKKRG